MLFGFLGKTWTLIIQFLFYFFLKLVILFITFISSQDPHVLLESKFMHKFDLQRKHTRKCIYKKTPGGKTTQFSSQKFN